MLRGLPSIIDSIFGKTDLDSISVNEIQDVIAEFPSFNAAHYLLSKKLKQHDAEAYEKQSMRTALYFNNVLWLNSILNSDDLQHEKVVVPKYETEQSVSEPGKSEYEDSVYKQSIYIDHEEEHNPESIISEFRESQPGFNENESQIQEGESLNFTPHTEPINENLTHVSDGEELIQVSNQETSDENTHEFISEYGVLEDYKPEQKFDESTFVADELHGDSSALEKSKEESVFVEDSLDVQTITENPATVESVTHPPEHSEEEIIKPVGQVERQDYTPEAVRPIFDAKNADSIVFAPYHMIDYFASQGIKLVLEDNPLDNFGKQLKSFTDWLKVMKKLPMRTPEVKTDEKEADRIKHFASNSLEDRDILTESMAEVLAKQGMYENAINLYQKLSLIYPPKSAYFASRIERLKGKLP